MKAVRFFRELVILEALTDEIFYLRIYRNSCITKEL